MVGGENKNNREVKERRKKRKRYAEERKQKLAGMISRQTVSDISQLKLAKISYNRQQL